MTDTKQLNVHATWLHKLADDLEKQQAAYGWANTCLLAADELERLTKALAIASYNIETVRRDRDIEKKWRKDSDERAHNAEAENKRLRDELAAIAYKHGVV